MRSVVLITVQHTGTSSMREMFKKAGYQERRSNHLRLKERDGRHRIVGDMSEGYAFRGHVYNKKVGFLPTLEDPLITTVRNQDDLEASWIQRYGDLKGPRMSLAEQQARWEEFVAPYADVIVPIENPIEALSEIEELLQITFPIDLPRLNAGTHGTLVETL